MDKPKKYEEHLMSAFGCEASDLESNETGSISRHQSDRLRRKRAQATSIWTLIVLLELLALAFVVPLGATGYPLSNFLSPLIFMIVAAAIGLVFGRRAYNLGADLNENRVHWVEGTIDLKVSAVQSALSFQMWIDTLRFSLTQPQYSALKNGDAYRIYYTPRSKQVLAVEWLRNGEDNLRDTDEMDAVPVKPTQLAQDETSSLSKQG